MPPYANGQATAHSYLNRNKQSIVLDLKDAASIDLIKAKISEFDIVIEQFRPDVMRRLGLDYATLAEINPRLIYCSITGYGQTGSYKDRAGHDINYCFSWYCWSIAADKIAVRHRLVFRLPILLVVHYMQSLRSWLL